MTAFIISVCRNYPWASPETISRMYCDAKDIHGILFWYKDLLEQQPPKKQN